MGTSRGGSGILYLIGGFKLAKVVLLIALAVGALKLLGQDLNDVLTRFSEQLRIDPGTKWYQSVLDRIGQWFPKLPMVAAGSFLYGALFGVEGVGLLMRKRWAEWLTVIITASFIPLEIWEIAKHRSVVKWIVLTLNVMILIYLIGRLWRQRKAAA